MSKRKKSRKNREPVDESKLIKKEKVVDAEAKEKKAAARKASYGNSDGLSGGKSAGSASSQGKGGGNARTTGSGRGS